MNHSDIYFLTSDIDWFIKLNKVNIHVASMGRPLPAGIIETLPQIYNQVSSYPMKEINSENKIWFNEMLVKNWLGLEAPKEIARYLSSFVVMARKGFFSFAPITFDSTDDDYYLMAKPIRYLDWEIQGIKNVDLDLQSFKLNDVGPFTATKIVKLIEEMEKSSIGG